LVFPIPRHDYENSRQNNNSTLKIMMLTGFLPLGCDFWVVDIVLVCSEAEGEYEEDVLLPLILVKTFWDI